PAPGDPTPPKHRTFPGDPGVPKLPGTEGGPAPTPGTPTPPAQPGSTPAKPGTPLPPPPPPAAPKTIEWDTSYFETMGFKVLKTTYDASTGPVTWLVEATHDVATPPK